MVRTSFLLREIFAALYSGSLPRSTPGLIRIVYV
jgi:hypothetical protein